MIKSTKQKQKFSFPYAFINPLATLLMIAVNALSFLPIGGLTTAQLADKYDNPFTPAGFTFAIWSVIYIFALIYVTVPLIRSIRGRDGDNTLVNRIGWLYGLSCVLNAGWILAWQYQYVGLSVCIIIAFLVTLIRTHWVISQSPTKKTGFDIWIVGVFFSLYLGWLSVATIANITAWTVSIGWSGWSISQIVWTNIMIIVATVLGTTLYAKYRDIPYNLVIIWALFGIMSKRLSIDPVVYSSIIMTSQICMAFLVGLITSRLFTRKS